MARQYRHPSPWQLFAPALAILVSVGAFHSATGQRLPGEGGFSRSNPAPNPETNTKHIAITRPGNRSAKVTPEETKRQVLEQTLKAGNDARDKFEFERALSSYRRVQELDRKDARAYYGLGNVYFDVYCYDSAIAFYSQAVALKGDYLDALLQLGYAHARKEHYNEAGEQFEAVVRVNPKNIGAKVGALYIQAKKGKYQEGIEGLNQIVNDKSIGDKERATASLALGDVYDMQQKWDEALRSFETATHLNPDSADAYLKLGISQLNLASEKFDLPEQEIRTQDKESLGAAARIASETIAKAIDQKHYDHPNGNIFLSEALAYQYNYQGALSKLDTYLAKVKELEDRVSFSKCDSAISRLYADGYWWKGQVLIREAFDVTDKQRRSDLLDKAIGEFKKAIEVKQDYTLAYTNLGTIYWRRGQYQQAIAEYQKALRYANEPSRAATYGALGSLYRILGSDHEAIDYLKKALELDPNSPSHYSALAEVYKKNGDFDEAIRLEKESIVREKQPFAHSYLYLAGIYFSRGRKNASNADYEEAIKLLTQAIRLNHTYAPAYVALGNVYKFYENGAQADKALANYKLALDYDPGNASIYFSIADLYSGVRQNYEAAIYNLSKAIEIDPRYVEAYDSLAATYAMKGDSDEALKWLTKANEIRPADSNPEPYFYTGASYALRFLKKGNEDDFNEAVKWLKKATAVRPSYAPAYQSLGIIYLARSYAEEALTSFEKATEYDAEDPENHLNLARVYAALKGNDSAAIIHLQKTLELKPNHAEALLMLGLAWHRKQDDAEAIKQMRKAVEANPKRFQTYLELAALYRGQKNHAEADKLLSKATEVRPTDAFSYKDLARVYEALRRNDDAVHYYSEAIRTLQSDYPWFRELWLCRIERLRRHYAEAISCFQRTKLPSLVEPGTLSYDLGLTYVANKNKKAALAQYEQLKQLKSFLAEELLRQISEMK